MHHFHSIVIGAGSGGLTVAIGLAKAGKKVALVERDLIGGDCTNYGCVPSKAFLDVARSGKVSGVKSILEEVRNRRSLIQDEETQEKIEKHGIKVFFGGASFTSEHEITVGEKKLTGKNFIIATGSRAQVVDIPGINKEDILTNKNVFELSDDIRDIVIVGGGYIGCELAEAFCLSGVKVTLVQRGAYLIPREEKESREFMQKHLEDIGVTISLNTTVKKAEGKQIYLSIMDGLQSHVEGKKKSNDGHAETVSVNFDKVLVALGRQPNVESLHLDNAKVNFSEKGIIVDKFLRTSTSHIYAIGDVVQDNPQFTHLANHQGRNIIRNILFPYYKTSLSMSTLPSCLYTSFEIARVGKTQEELESKMDKDSFRTFIYQFTQNDRSKVTGDTSGFIKMHFSLLTGKILGATIVGKNAGEIISTLSLAMEKSISAYTLANMMYPYPTKSEGIKKVCDMFTIYTLTHLREELSYFIKKNFFRFFPVVLGAAIIIGFFVIKSSYQFTYEDMALYLYQSIKSSGLVGGIVFTIAYALRPIILFPASFMTLMSGAIWGPVYGMIYSVIGSNLSGQTGYFLSYFLGKSILPSSSENTIHGLKEKALSKPFLTVIGGRLLFIPYDALSFAAGFTRIDWKYYTLGTLLGTLPGSLCFVLAGASFYGIQVTSFSEALKSIDITLLYFAALIFIISLVTSKILKKYFTI